MSATTADSVDVILRDGGTLRLRPPTSDDTDALLGFFRALSSQSLHHRFHGFPQLRPQLVESLADPDWSERGALLGTLADEEGERVVAVGNYVRLRDPALAESAFAVADEEQGRGIGTRLLERLAARAAAVGIERFVAEVLPENRPMLGVFERAGFELKRELASGVVEVEFPIASTERFEQSVEERDHTAVVASLPGIAVAGPRLNATFAARSAPSGNIGFSSQSGSLGLALLEAADSRGLGLSAFVSIGNKADVSSNDLLEWWEEDEETDVVLLYVESFGSPSRFGRLAPGALRGASRSWRSRAAHPPPGSARPARTRRPWRAPRRASTHSSTRPA